MEGWDIRLEFRVQGFSREEHCIQQKAGSPLKHFTHSHAALSTLWVKIRGIKG